MSNSNKRILFILSIIFLLVVIPSSFASDINDNSTLTDAIYPDSNSIYVDIEATDEGTGSQENPYNNLSRAIDSFDSTANSNIYVKNGTYVFDTQLSINKAVTIVGESREGVIFDGNNTSALFRVSFDNVQFNSLSFVNGLGNSGYSGGYAGAIDASGRHLVIDNCIFENNAAGAVSAGGGSEWNPADIQIKNSAFINNSKIGWSLEGGAVQIAGIYSYLNMTNCVFINNTATNGGGAVSINNGRKESFISNCEFISNTANFGSAIYFSNAYDATIKNCKFIENVANDNDSGVIDFTGSYYQRKLSVKDNVFENNIPDKDYNVDGKIEIIDLGSNDKLIGEDVVMDRGEDKNFTVTLTDAEGNPIVSKLITVSLTDFFKKVTVLDGITNENGQAIIPLINLTAGTYTVASNFAGDSNWDNVSTINQIKIKAEHSNNIVFNESIVKVKAGESYLVQGYIMDEYISYVVQAFSTYDITWVTHSGGKRVTTNNQITNGRFVVDVLDFDLSTQNEYYYINFTSTNENGNVAYGTLIVDTSIPLPPVDEDVDVIYVAKDGSDEFGDGSEENPLATVQVALYVNEVFGGNKIVMVKEGIYNISNYEIYANVSVIGEKGKTIFRQHTGDDGMLWLDNGVTTNFTNITFIDGYRSPYTLMGGSVIVVRYEHSIANFKGCEFYNNSGSSDGMMYVANGGIAYIDDCIFKNNSGKTFNPAGAILVLDGYLSVNNSYFTENYGAEGGAIFVGGDSIAFIENTVFYKNTAHNDSAALAGGGAIYVNNWNTHIYNCSFIENYAQVNGGAIYILTGQVEIQKSLFENNRVNPGNGKGSTIASDSGYTVLLYVSDSILFSDDSSKLISITGTYDNVENEIILNDNHWGNSFQTGVREYAIIEFNTSEENVTEGDLVYITVKFAPNDGGEYERSLHDYLLNVSADLGSVDKESIVIADNVAQLRYYATKAGNEVITFAHGLNTYKLKFDVSKPESAKKDFNANISVDDNKTNVIVEVPEDISDNITIILDSAEYSVAANDSKAILPINVLPGNHTVRVAYAGDLNYNSYISDTLQFNVEKYDANLNVHVNSGVIGDDFIAQITANDYLTDDVIVSINNKNYTVKVTNGTGSTSLKDLIPGNYTVYATFKGNSYINEDKSNATFSVSASSIDMIFVSVDGNDTTGDGSIDSPYATIFKALDRNNRLGGNKTIIVDEGNYVLNRYAITDNVTIKADGVVVISADNANHLYIGGKVRVALDGLTFVNGSGLDAGSIEMGSDDAGNIGKELLITNCSFINNTGAVGAIKSYAKTTISESVFVDNTATGNSGSNQAIVSILDNEALINTSIFLNNNYGKYVVVSTVLASANTNFWGTNDKPRDVSDNVKVDTWACVIPSISEDIRTKTNYSLTVEFLETADGVSFNEINGNMPDLTVDLTSEIGSINQSSAVISNNIATVNYNVSVKGNELITVDLNGKTLANLTFDIDVPEYDKIYVSNEGNDSAIGSMGAPILTIAHALEINKAEGGNKTIVILPGVYKEHNLAIDDIVTIIGENATIDGENNEIFAIAADTEIHNLTLTNANVAINHASGDLKVNGLEFTNSENAIKSNSMLTVVNSKFTNNTGIVIDAIDSAFISDSAFNQNDVDSIISSSKSLSLLNSTFNSNNVIEGTIAVKGNASIISNEFNSNEMAISAIGASGVIDKNKFNDDEITLKASDFDVTSNTNTKINLLDSKISDVIVTFLEGSTVFAQNGTIQVNATVTDSMGNLINGGKVKFTDNGNYIGQANVENGKAMISSEFTKGNHSISGSFDGDDDAEIIGGLLRIDVDYYWFIGDDKYETLAQAVESAEWGDVIKGVPGTYYISKQAIGHRYFSLEPWEVLKSVTITSLGDSPVILSGDKNQMFFVDIGSELSLQNVVIANAGNLGDDGGAIETMYDANLTIINCTFENNTAKNGGAVYAGGNLILKDSVFKNNFAGLAGALEVANLYYTTGTISIDNVTFANNKATYGGAVYLGSSDVDLDNVKFINNTANVAGALFVREGTVRVSNAEFISNTATSDDSTTAIARGGAVHNLLGDLYFENTKFINNSAEGIGGALELENGLYGTISWTTFDNCDFINNSAVDGGAMYLGETYDPYVRISDSIFESNAAENNGAAIYDNCAHVTVENTEFANNYALNGFDIIHVIGEFITGEGFSPDQTFMAELTVENSSFKNTTSDYVIFSNAYGVVDIRDTTFDNQNMIIFNRGDATFINDVVTNSNDYVIENLGNLSLTNNKFDTPILNQKDILTMAYIVVLDNETKSAVIGENYTLKAVVTDDNGNIIKIDELMIVIDDEDADTTLSGEEFISDYVVSEGSHIVTAKCDDEGLTYLKLKTGTLIGKPAISMTVNVNDAVVGENAVITVSADESAKGNVTVKVNNKTYEAPIQNGQAKFEIPDLAAGEYPVEITYSGDDKYAPTTAFDKLVVDKVSDYQFDVEISKDTTNKSATIEITLPEDITGNITVAVDGKNYSVEVKDGKAKVTVNNLTSGNHEVYVSFEGNDKYSNSTKQATFKADKLESFVNVKVADIVLGENAVINLEVPEDASGDIIVSVGEKEYVISVNNGKVILEVSDLVVGSYSVDVTYVGDSKYLDSSNKTSFKVIEHDVSVKNTLIELTIDSLNISGVLKDIEGNPIANAVICYVIEGMVNGNVTTGSDGAFKIQGVEGKKITFQYLGNDVNIGSIAVITLNNVSGQTVDPVVRKATYIVVDKAFTRVTTDYYAGERGGYHTAYLLDEDGNPVVNRTVQIAVNGPIYNLTTDEKGAVQLQINLNSAMIYTYALSFKGDDEYQGSPIASSKLTLTKKTTSIAATKKTFKAKAKTKTISVTLKTIKNPYDGKTYLKSGKKITLKINGKTYTAKTNAKGIAKFNIKITKKGKYAATIKFAGDKTYKASSKKILVTIK